jgi:hypothetical protein
MLYFNDTTGPSPSYDQDWNNINNWWQDSSSTTQAVALPTSSNNVTLNSNIFYNFGDGSTPTVGNMYVSPFVTLSLPINISGTAVFDANSVFSYSLMTGNAIFKSGAYNNFGSITGNVSFYNNSGNAGFIYGNAFFYDISYNSGEVQGDATFNDNSSNSGLVTGTIYCYSPNC